VIFAGFRQHRLADDVAGADPWYVTDAHKIPAAESAREDKAANAYAVLGVDPTPAPPAETTTPPISKPPSESDLRREIEREAGQQPYVGLGAGDLAGASGAERARATPAPDGDPPPGGGEEDPSGGPAAKPVRNVQDPATGSAVEPGVGLLAENIRSILAAITERPVGARVEPVAHVELGKVVEVGATELAHVGEVAQSEQWQTVGPRELEDFTNKVLSAIEAAGIETVTHAVHEILRDHPFSAETLRRVAEQAGPLRDIADSVAETIEPTDSTRRHALGLWILGGAILLAAGVAAVALIGSVAEMVLTNELALAAAVGALAALLRRE